jgi:hypothetical protein
MYRRPAAAGSNGTAAMYLFADDGRWVFSERVQYIASADSAVVVAATAAWGSAEGASETGSAEPTAAALLQGFQNLSFPVAASAAPPATAAATNASSSGAAAAPPPSHGNGTLLGNSSGRGESERAAVWGFLLQLRAQETLMRGANGSEYTAALLDAAPLRAPEAPRRSAVHLVRFENAYACPAHSHAGPNLSAPDGGASNAGQCECEEGFTAGGRTAADARRGCAAPVPPFVCPEDSDFAPRPVASAKASATNTGAAGPAANSGPDAGSYGSFVGTIAPTASPTTAATAAAAATAPAGFQDCQCRIGFQRRQRWAGGSPDGESAPGQPVDARGAWAWECAPLSPGQQVLPISLRLPNATAADFTPEVQRQLLAQVQATMGGGDAAAAEAEQAFHRHRRVLEGAHGDAAEGAWLEDEGGGAEDGAEDGADADWGLRDMEELHALGLAADEADEADAAEADAAEADAAAAAAESGGGSSSFALGGLLEDPSGAGLSVELQLLVDAEDLAELAAQPDTGLDAAAGMVGALNWSAVAVAVQMGGGRSGGAVKTVRVAAVWVRNVSTFAFEGRAIAAAQNSSRAARKDLLAAAAAAAAAAAKPPAAGTLFWAASFFVKLGLGAVVVAVVGLGGLAVAKRRANNLRSEACGGAGPPAAAGCIQHAPQGGVPTSFLQGSDLTASQQTARMSLGMGVGTPNLAQSGFVGQNPMTRWAQAGGGGRGAGAGGAKPGATGGTRSLRRTPLPDLAEGGHPSTPEPELSAVV